MGLNLRVVKLSKEYKVLDSQSIVIYLTEGYHEKIGNCIKKIQIEFCPFCGVNLDYLKKEENIQDYMDFENNLNWL